MAFSAEMNQFFFLALCFSAADLTDFKYFLLYGIVLDIQTIKTTLTEKVFPVPNGGIDSE